MSDILHCTADASGAITTRANKVGEASAELPGNVAITEAERAVWRELYLCRGLTAVRSIRELSINTGFSAREVKGAVAGLIVRHRMQIGSSRRRGENGYYLIATREELRKTIHPLARQAKSMFARIRALCGADDELLLELAGQLRLDVEERAS